MDPAIPDLASNSIHDLFRAFPREKLYIRPAFWTRLHVLLLGCRFSTKETQNLGPRLPTPSLSLPVSGFQDEPEEDPQSQHLGYWKGTFYGLPPKDELLAANLFSPENHAAMWNILSTPPLDFKVIGEFFDFYFARRKVDTLGGLILTRRQDKVRSSSEPHLGYVEYDSITTRRRRDMTARYQHPWNNAKSPGTQLILRKLAQLEPVEWSQDPYLVALLISLAQGQRRYWKSASRQRAAPSIEPSAYTVLLLVTKREDNEFIYLFEAVISSPLLKKLDYPREREGNSQGISITLKPLPYKPYNNFKLRLTILLNGTDGAKDYPEQDVARPAYRILKRAAREEVGESSSGRERSVARPTHLGLEPAAREEAGESRFGRQGSVADNREEVDEPRLGHKRSVADRMDMSSVRAGKSKKTA